MNDFNALINRKNGLCDNNYIYVCSIFILLINLFEYIR